MAGQDFDALKKQAATREFKPVPLGVTASMTIHNKLRTIDSQNVVAKLEGGDPKLKDEYVVYTAHWDHLGGRRRRGSSTARKTTRSGAAGLLEIARAFTKLPAPPKRSILFLAVTAEEQGLLGSQYYSVTPIYPLAKTVANINMDGCNVHGRTKDLTLDRLRRVGSRRLRARRGRRTGPRDSSRRRGAGEGLLLPLRSLQLRQAGRARARSRRAASTSSASRPTTARSARRLHRARLSQAVRRREAGLGSERRARRSEGVLRGRLPRRAGRQVPGVEAGQRVQGQARGDAARNAKRSQERRLFELRDA